MNSAGRRKIVGGGGGGELHLSSGCPPDKLNSLAYFCIPEIFLKKKTYRKKVSRRQRN